MSGRSPSAPPEPGFVVRDAGRQVTVQEYPGRLGLRRKGLPSSGPMDRFACRAANATVGNDETAAVLEIPMGGLTIEFLDDHVVSLCGPGSVRAELNRAAVPLWEGMPVRDGDVLRCGRVRGPGFRMYLALHGGIDVPTKYGSRATNLLGRFGGFEGRELIAGDFVPVSREPRSEPLLARLPLSRRPVYTTHWEIEVVRGPHADTSFFDDEGWRSLTSSEWSVDLRADRVYARLSPRPIPWADARRAEAANGATGIAEFPYPPGGINVQGDVLNILGPDGPTAGGFPVIATVAEAAMWKVGQLRPGRDTVRFRDVSRDEAVALSAESDATLEGWRLEPARGMRSG